MCHVTHTATLQGMKRRARPRLIRYAGVDSGSKHSDAAGIGPEVPVGASLGQSTAPPMKRGADPTGTQTFLESKAGPTESILTIFPIRPSSNREGLECRVLGATSKTYLALCRRGRIVEPTVGATRLC